MIGPFPSLVLPTESESSPAADTQTFLIRKAGAENETIVQSADGFISSSSAKTS